MEPTPEPVVAPTPEPVVETISPIMDTASPTAPAPTSVGDQCASAGGIPGIESADGKACCLSLCGQCGGSGCATVGAPTLCCAPDVIEYGEACSVTNEAPCYIDEAPAPSSTIEPVAAPTPEPVTASAAPTAPSTAAGNVCTLAGGIPGIESSDGQACCVASCGQCGGVGCSTLGPASDCCVTDIVELGEACSLKNEAPCYIGDGEVPAPTSEAPTSSPSPGHTTPDVDLDGDGYLDSWEFMGCIENPPHYHHDFDAIPSDVELSPIVCFEICGGMSARYFVLTRDDDCLCGFDLYYVHYPAVIEDASTCYDHEEYELYRLYDNVPAATPTPDVVPAATAEPAVAPTPEPVLAPTLEPVTEPTGPTAPAPTTAGVVCVLAGGIPGIESSDGQACCVASCGQCGGIGCSTVGAASDCCVTDIVDLGEACSVTNVAPCSTLDDAMGIPTPASSPDTLPPSGDGGNMDSADVDIDGDGNVDSFEPVGCFVFDDADALEFDNVGGDDLMTRKLCFETCAAEAALYFALFKGSLCACGHDETFLTKEKEIGHCDMPCTGDNMEMCGNDYNYDLFELFESAEMSINHTPSPVAVSAAKPIP